MDDISRRATCLVVAALVGGFVLASNSSAWGMVIIDDFEVGPLNLPDLTPSAGTEHMSQTLSASHVVKGVRSLENYGQSIPSILDLTVTAGDDAISMTSRHMAYFNFIYNAGGYLNLDLSGEDRFELTFPRLDGQLSLIITLRSGNSFPRVVLSVTQPGVLTVPFSSFGSPNWADIDLVRLEFTTQYIFGVPSHTESLSDFRAVPEPSTLTLLGLSLGILGRQARRRRRRS